MKILCVEDLIEFQDALCSFLGKKHPYIRKEQSVSGARRALEEDTFDVVLLDKFVNDGITLPLVREIRSKNRETCIVILTSDFEFSGGTAALDSGVHEYIIKPTDTLFDITDKEFQKFLNEASVRIENARKNLALINRSEILMRQVLSFPDEQIVGRSLYIEKIKNQILSYRGNLEPVLISGPIGTGKTLIAKSINRVQGRTRPLHVLDLKGLGPEQARYKIFGKSSSNLEWMLEDTRSLLELTNGGDLVIKEISKLTHRTQEELLQFIETGQYYTAEGQELKASQVRVIATSSVDLKELANENLFNYKLWKLLSVNTIPTLPLRSHLEDLHDLITNFILRSAGDRYSIEEDAVKFISTLTFSANIKKLKSFVEGALINVQACGRFEITLEDLDGVDLKTILLPQNERDLSFEHFEYSKKWIEANYLSSALKLLNWDRKKLQSKLKMSKSSLYQKSQEYRLWPEEDHHFQDKQRRPGRPRKNG